MSRLGREFQVLDVDVFLSLEDVQSWRLRGKIDNSSL